MRKECKSQTELIILNEKLHSYFNESHRLKKYEDDKKKVMEQKDDTLKVDEKQAEIAPGNSTNLLDENDNKSWDALAMDK